MRNWRSLTILVMVLSLFLAACGGDDVADPVTGEGGTDEGTESAGDSAEPTEADDETPDGSDADGADGAGGELSADLAGAGASFPDPVYQTWVGEWTQNVESGVTINYNAIGSGGGREAFIGQEVDFAGSDAFMSDEDIDAAIEARGGGEVLHIPMVFGGVVVAFNIEGLEDLTLDAAAISSIFRGEITNINDPAIAELNDGVELPDQDLTVVHRSDGSGTTSIFTKYLEDADEAWADEVGSGSEVEWPTGLGGDQNQGVQQTIAQQPGGIGYLSLEFAVEAGLPFAQVINADGEPIEASTASVGAATENLDLPGDLRFDILGVGGEGYPIAGATWVLAYTTGYDESIAESLQAWLTWSLEEGDDLAAELGYAPVSDATQQLSLDMVARINAE
jgi:phosphate transport system substrate-binding protein